MIAEGPEDSGHHHLCLRFGPQLDAPFQAIGVADVVAAAIPFAVDSDEGERLLGVGHERLAAGAVEKVPLFEVGRRLPETRDICFGRNFKRGPKITAHQASARRKHQHDGGGACEDRGLRPI